MPTGRPAILALILLIGFARPAFAPHGEPPRQHIVAPAFDDARLEAEIASHWTDYVRDCGVEILRAKWEADNIRFYENLSDEQFDARTIQCGMDKHPDLLLPRMQKILGVGKDPQGAPSIIVEIGGGRGRVIDYLVRNTTIPSIISVERSKRHAVKLRDRMRVINKEAGYPRVTVYSMNLLGYLEQGTQHHGVVDVVTWLWWGFAEVHPIEKLLDLQLLSKVIRPGGIIVIDLPTSEIVPTEVTEYHTNFINFKMTASADAPTLHLHRFSTLTLNRLAKEAGLIPLDCDAYTAESSPHTTRRALCYFTKPHILD